ncbi:MAG: protein kinase family protein [Bacteroidales bacterium]|nr:protein kinase family protein [Bacteroidales bacterium]
MKKFPSPEDYELAIDTPALIKSSKLAAGYVEKSNDIVIRYVGGFCIVFPFYTPNGKKAVRCWYADVDNIQKRTKIIADELIKANLPYFVSFEYESNGLATNVGVQPIVIMDWVEALEIKEYVGKHKSNPQVLRKLAENFLQMTNDLHKHNFSHGDLQHGNILVKNDGSIVLVDYDSMFVPGLENYPEDIKGLPAYQHPKRHAQKNMTPKADYFSELIIYTAIKAIEHYPDLWDELHVKEADTSFIFSAEDIKSMGTADIFRRLSANSELKVCCDAIAKASCASSIESLLPLSEAIVPQHQRISDKWKRVPPRQQVEFVPDTSSIRSKWNKK